ncbi:hypothetical protein ACH5RR_033773 [Cinchona calisaya]|uniref:Large ribosomal subunit protein uL16m n=1 Tax=Cinchona calisaya TaxID=153742 RepID=A0ABD2YBX7_9GENT
MGRGKGNPTGWVARVSTGQILFEMDGVTLSNARQAATLAVHKTIFVNQSSSLRRGRWKGYRFFKRTKHSRSQPHPRGRGGLSTGASSIEKQKGQLAELIRPLIEEEANKSQSIRTLPSPRDFVEELINRSGTPLVQKVNYDHNHEDLRYLKRWLT